MRNLVARCLVASLGREVADSEVERALGLLIEHYRAHLLDSTTLYDGVAEALRELHAHGAVLTMATNKHEAMARAILCGLGAEELFVEILGGDSLPVRKPDPGVVFELGRRTGIPAPDTLFVGDSTVDVATARAAGVAVCVVAWGFTPADALVDAAPDYLITQPRELLGIAQGRAR
jgi:phosphoglycolate phosphatase